jgi:hypothetical protein
MLTLDQATIDSTGAFYVNQLERLDQEVHEPLIDVTWGRDIKLREDITLGDEEASWTNSTFASPGGFRPGGKSWASKNTNAIQRVQLDIGKTVQPLTIWAEQLSYSLPELASAQQAGRPIDSQYYDALKTKHEMDTDEQVYIGDIDLGYTGLTNNTAVTATNVINGASGFPQWATKTPDEILADINALLGSVWAASGWAIVPEELRLPPTEFSLLVNNKVSTAGNMSIMNYVMENSLSYARNKKPLNIQAVKWLIGRGAGGSDRMMVYTNDKKRVRFPMTDLQRTMVEYRALNQIVTYWGKLGVVEAVYPNTIGYADGIG